MIAPAASAASVSTPAGSHLRLVSAPTDTPAYNPLSEDVLVRACLFDASAVARFDWIRPEHFFLKVRGYIWAAMQAMAARAAHPLPPEPWGHDVARELIAMGRWADVGKGAVFSGLLSECSETVDLAAHAEVVFDCWRQREIETVAVKLAARARHGADGADALVQGLEADLVRLQSLTRRPDEGAPLGDAARSAVEAIEARRRGDDSALRRTPTGFAEIDRLANGGMGQGGLWILGGRPGEGKTSLAMNIVMNDAFDGVGATVFSLEMSRQELAQRILASESGVAVQGDLDDEQVKALHDAVARVQRLPVIVDDTPGLHLDELIRRAKRAAARFAARGKRLGLVVVDYLQLIKVTPQHGRKRADEIADVSKALKQLARELGVTVVALAQLNRESEREQRRPRMTDLRDCGQIEQDADWIGILWRQRHTPAWLTDLAICKQRTGQKTADLQLGWQPELTRFSDA